MFRVSSAHLQEDTVVNMQHMVLSLSMRVPGGFVGTQPELVINHLTPNGHYMGRTAQLTSRCCILYI